MNYYETRSVKQQNYFAENGIFPIKEEGKTAIYIKTKELHSLLDEYFIIKHMFGGRY